ncbi:MAG: hypothetical protein KJ749_09120, partial [Planctomycetes bacterium]|nr:hypothetical protein [Planctomycetota bacterium]
VASPPTRPLRHPALYTEEGAGAPDVDSAEAPTEAYLPVDRLSDEPPMTAAGSLDSAPPPELEVP